MICIFNITNGQIDFDSYDSWFQTYDNQDNHDIDNISPSTNNANTPSDKPNNFNGKKINISINYNNINIYASYRPGKWKRQK